MGATTRACELFLTTIPRATCCCAHFRVRSILTATRPWVAALSARTMARCLAMRQNPTILKPEPSMCCAAFQPPVRCRASRADPQDRCNRRQGRDPHRRRGKGCHLSVGRRGDCRHLQAPQSEPHEAGKHLPPLVRRSTARLDHRRSLRKSGEAEEWFLVPLKVIDEAVQRVRDGSITDVVYDPKTARLVA